MSARIARRTLATVAVFMALAGAPFAQGAVGVGDSPKLQFTAANDGKTVVSLEKLKGKMIVVDFWATWCGPCMAEAGHMVALHKEWGPKGLVMIGISLDADKGQMLQVAKQQGFDWPHYFDGQVWQNRIGQEWGVNSIPRTFLIGPDGTVLWTGHSARIDQPLKDAFAKHPPQLVDPKVLAAANASLDKIESALKEGSVPEAVKLLGGLPAEAKADPKYAQRLGAVEKQFDDYASKVIAEIDPLIQDKKYVEAGMRLSDLSKGLGNGPAGVNVRKKLNEMMAIPEAKRQFEAAQRSKLADDELLIARRLAAEGKKEQAYVKFRAVATNFPDTKAAAEAKAAAAEYEKDPAFVKQAKDLAAGDKAKALLGLAENYKRAGRSDLARDKYLEVTKQFPGTSYAAKAEEALRELQKK
jgi:thiol-disulfide isomerase/thioredoxin